MTPDTGHMTCDTWHLTRDMWQMVGGEHSLKIAGPSILRFGNKVFFEDLEEKDESTN